MKLALDVGAGRIDFGASDTALLDEATFRFDWDPEPRILSLANGSVLFGDTGGEFRGLAVWPETREGDVRVALEGLDILLAARDNPLPQQVLRQLVLNMKVGRESGIATIERFAAVAEQGSIQGAGSMAMVDGELSAGMTFVVSPMTVDLLTHMWPVNVANGARKWIIANVEAGQITGGTIEMALTESMLKRNAEGRMVLPDDAVQVQFGLEGVRINGFGDLPPAEGLKGTGFVSGRTFISDIAGGHFVTKSGRTYPVNSGKFEIPDHSQKPATGVLVLDGSGSAKALGEIVDSEPLHVLRSEKQTADTLKGKADAKVRISFPFVKEIKKEHVDYSAKIALSDFTSSKKIRGYKVEKADLVINTDGTRVDIAGKGTIDGLETNLDLTTSTDNSISLSSKFELVLSDADRRALGLGLDNWLKGPVTVRAVQGGKQKGVTRIEVDLTRAVLAVNEIGWSKKANVRGRASFDLIEKGKTYQVRSFKLSGDGFEASGQADIHKSDGLERLTIERMALSRGDRLRMDVVQSRPDFYSIKVTGDLLDLRGRLMAGRSAGGPTGGAQSSDSYLLNANIKKVVGLSGHAIHDFAAGLHVVNGKDKDINVRGLIDGRYNLSVNTNQGNNPTIQLSTDNTGALLRFVGALDQMLGGRLALAITLENGWDQISGSVFLKDFSIGGLVQREQSQKSTTERVNTNFDKFSMTYNGKDGVYSLHNGVAKSTALGATVSGTVDMRNKTLRLQGTYIPAYGLNNVFSRLPIIGRALGNRKNEGLLGLTYRIKGEIANPKIIINPASLLAPGVLRKLFEYR